MEHDKGNKMLNTAFITKIVRKAVFNRQIDAAMIVL